MHPRVYIPGDSAALSIGADQVARELATQAEENKLSLDIIRNGSRGMYWLEPLIEVETAQGRVAYGPVRAEDISSLIKADFVNAGDHPLGLGLTEDIPYLKKQQRLTFSRVGIIDPLSLDDFRATGGFKGLDKALAMSQQEIIDAVEASGLRGRGGAAFPVGKKMANRIEYGW